MITTQAIGSLGRNCEVRQLDKGSVINFSIGISVGYGDKKSTIWLECSRFAENTKVSEYLTKGTKVFVSGEPAIRTYQKKDGTTGVSFTLRVDRIELLGSRKDEQPATAEPVETFVAPGNAHIEDAQDLPF